MNIIFRVLLGKNNVLNFHFYSFSNKHAIESLEISNFNYRFRIFSRFLEIKFYNFNITSISIFSLQVTFL